jgi:hypothetical protein
MISAETGDVSFTNGLYIKGYSNLQQILRDARFTGRVTSKQVQTVPFAKWDLGILDSDQGSFDVYLITDQNENIVAVFSTAKVEFPDDRHHQIILDDLRGQTEFTWGMVSAENKWLAVVYSDSAAVPKPKEVTKAFLFAHAEYPKQSTEQGAAANP